MYNIFKLKSNLKTVTKEIIKLFKIMILGFILITTMLIIKYKLVYEVTIENETLGYISAKDDLKNIIEEEIINKQGENIDSISLKQEPQYEEKLVARHVKTNEEQILEKLKETAITTYKFYEVTLNEEKKVYVDTIEEAEEVVNKIKSEYDGNDLELNLAITEKYTENQEEVKTDNVQIAEKSVEEEVEHMIEEKEAEEALATINGINLSVLPVSGRITSRFGNVSSIRSYVEHTGLDIACVKGTDIKVVADGKVIFADWSGDLGKLVKIDHGNGIQTWYAHCSEIYVSEGDEVSSGDIISAVGSTGNSTGPHLHFEIRIDGIAVNPQSYIY